MDGPFFFVTHLADGGYDKARSVFYGGFDRRLRAIVRAANAADIAHVFQIAQ
jgi:hypothetical protein